jgi:hypothetical protein
MQRNRIIKLYVEEGYSCIELSTLYNVKFIDIKKLLLENNIEFRNISDSKTKRSAEKYEKTCTELYGETNVRKTQQAKDKAKATCEKRYGVSNGANSEIAKLKHYILGNMPEPGKETEFRKYRKQVEKITVKNKKALKLSEFCYYTGLKIYHKCWYNDAVKATIDHKISVIYGFENSISAEEIGSIDNLVWCAKIINTYKRDLTEEQFKALDIIKRFKKYESEINQMFGPKVS